MIVNNTVYEMKELLKHWKKRGVIMYHATYRDFVSFRYATKKVEKWNERRERWDWSWYYYYVYVEAHEYRKFLDNSHLYVLKLKRISDRIDVAPLDKCIEQFVKLSVIDRLS